ncbi:DNA-directed RNA polymerases IV and V subunit 2 [Andrographis paniculata]|uniref:DNA-directed RNA polymerases IV and V subunit 2 n=1 Tax=Andrographis paniculata TaxID=175694 RepID=UPI0021E85342|nr:DNA-directed RNA polymerases IV and V subunit 2 [Andrographis paniculata]
MIPMGAKDFLGGAGPSSLKGKAYNGSAKMDIDDDEEEEDIDDMEVESSGSDDEPHNSLQGLNEGSVKEFCKKATRAFFDEYGLISHQINSYNDFVRHGIQKVFDSFGEILVEPGYDPSKKNGDWRRGSIKFGKVTLEKPRFWPGEKFQSVDGARVDLELYPRHARLQNMTYSCRIKVMVHVEIYEESFGRSDKFQTGTETGVAKTEVTSFDKELMFGRLPIMVNSDLCWMNTSEKRDCEFDQGGYFVIKGTEKTFIAQEQICLKRLWVSKEPTWTIAYRPVFKRRRVYVKLVPRMEPIIGGEMILTVYFSVCEVPMWLLFFALGVQNDKEVLKLIDLDVEEDSVIANILLGTIYDADKKHVGFRKDGNAQKFIREHMMKSKFPPAESVDECIRNYLFPNLKTPRQKACFLAYMVKCLLEAYRGRRKPDNRDDLRNKRLELAGELLERELKVHIKHAERRLVRSLQRDLDKERDVNADNFDQYLDASIVTNGLCRAFSTGAWSHPYKRMERVSGVVATVRRTNPLQATADMRKTRQQVSYTGRVGDARYPHPSHWGKICYISTPDGENCGLVKNLASTALISTNILEQKSIIRTLHKCGMEKLDETSSNVDGKQKIFLDGDWVGVCKDSSSFVSKLRSKRRRSVLPHQVEVKRDATNGEVRIFADAGRILRPLLVVKNLKKIRDLKGGFSFGTLLQTGIVELVGAEEEEDNQTAWEIRYLFRSELENLFSAVKYTHCEIDSSFLLGLSCGIIPFANHDHARRVLYQSEKHSQQAIGYSTTNPTIRVDTNSHQMYYPQRPLFRSFLADNLGSSRYNLHKGMVPHPEYFNGQCAIVAVNVHLGYNQEDSLVMNRSSLERGMFRTEHVRSYKSEVENSEAAPGKKVKDDELINFGKIPSKIGRVDSLDEDGLPYVGANLQTGDIVIGKHAASGVDHSIKLKHTEKGMVQKVVLSANDEGKNYAVVSLRQVRSPCLGDKFSSMHGQKGVLGFLECQENFPFTQQGIVPDIVINPHAFPSRQTPGQLLEAALGKGIALGGHLKQATPFSTPSVEDITSQLHRLGFSRWGHERVFDGRTGEMVRSLIFMGPTFYQRLTHMAEDKVKFRNTGPVHPLTRQPVADRKRFGGIKFGEMERDCLIAHGAAANLHERLFTLSDSSQMHICRKCKNMANVIQRPVFGGRKIRGPYCRVCESVEDVVRVNVPYGAKLLCQELFSMGISLKFDTKLC